MKNKILVLTSLCFFFSSLSSSVVRSSPDIVGFTKYTERQKIELLLESINGLKDVKFERNGSIHEASEAVKLLKSKLNKVGVENLTAQEFIDKIASKSSTSGKPYYIVYPDGDKITAGEFLQKKLIEIEAH